MQNVTIVYLRPPELPIFAQTRYRN